jgi:ribosomal-protein-alanine N-acetyltransferase
VTPGDLATLHARSFTLPRPWTEAEMASVLGLTGVMVLTEDGGFLIGRTVADEAELLTLAVAPELRRTGIGGRLLAAFLAEVHSRGAERAFLEVAADNAAALALYARAGFTTAGRRRGYYRTPDGRAVDALVLACAPGPVPADPGPPGI